MKYVQLVKSEGIGEKPVISHRLPDLFMPARMIANHSVSHSSRHYGL